MRLTGFPDVSRRDDHITFITPGGSSRVDHKGPRRRAGASEVLVSAFYAWIISSMTVSKVTNISCSSLVASLVNANSLPYWPYIPAYER